MKPINSPTRTISLIGLSLFIHGAAFWTAYENVSLHQVTQLIQETHNQVGRSELWEKVSARHQTVEVDLSDAQTAPVEQKNSIEPKVEEKEFAFKKVESVQIEKKAPVQKAKKKIVAKKSEEKEKIATILPEKKTIDDSSASEEKSFPQKTVDIPEPQVKLIPVSDSLDGVIAATDTDKITEAQAKIETTPQELKEVEESTDLLSELKESEDVAEEAAQTSTESQEPRSYMSLRQASGNQPPQYPLEARRQGLQGRVVLKYFVTEEGAVKDVSVEKSSGFKILDNEALRAISSYRYYPGQSGWAEHPVKFTLNR